MAGTSQQERLEYYRTAERPDLEMWLLDADGSLVDFSDDYTFEFKLAPGVVAGAAAVFTKDEGITGAAGSGTESTGDPNVTITFVAGELDDLTPGGYVWQVRARTDASLDRVYQGQLNLLEVIE